MTTEISSKKTELYFDELVAGVRKEYAIAEDAKKMGFDPVNSVEIPLAMSLAEKCVGLISTVYPQLSDKRITERILELEKEYGALDVAVSFKIAEEISKEKYCKFTSLLEAIDAGIRVGFAYNTLGVVSSPIEGFTGVELGKTKEGKEYFIANFSGPIRSAGTTASCVVLMLIDYLRETFGYEKYDPDENEVKRYFTENYDYHERVNNLQYLPTEEEILFLAKNIPIQVSGDPTEKIEVSNYKDLPRVPTNQIRGGMCLCFSEGLAQKAQKGLRLWRSVQAKGFKATGWEFLDEYIKIHKKREKGTADASPTYIKDLVAGRPVFGHPSAAGGFRFRYGRSRVAGFSATSIHPATMAMSDDFLSAGTQLKIEKPTKGCVVTACDSIDGPIVKLKNGSVKRIMSYDEGKKLYKDTEEIIYFGDILFPLGDVINRNYELLKAGYVEEWWYLELKRKIANILFKEVKKKLEDGTEKIDKVANDELTDENKKQLNDDLGINWRNLDFDRAMEISKKYDLPLYPKYLFYWTQISREQFFSLLEFLQHSVWRNDGGKLVLPYDKLFYEKFKDAKRALELLGVEHEVVFDNLVISHDSLALLISFGIEKPVEDGKSMKEIFFELAERMKKENSELKLLDLMNLVSKFKLKDKAGTFIGTRMGRPEKAKLRKLTGSPNVLFPVGEEGGRMRSVQEAVKNEFIKGEFPLYFCETCGKETVYRKCETCGKETQRKYFCRDCDKIMKDKCEHEKCAPYSSRKIDSKYFLTKSLEQLGMKREETPELIKGVRGTSSEDHDIENLAKGILRAKHNLTVNKDGTIRYDATELPISHFKPREIGVGFEKLKLLGYEQDAYGAELVSDEQILELKPHDILLPCCPETQDERADDVFINLTQFMDDLLEKLYKLPRYYNVKKREDLVGHLVVCMAPHNCAGVIGRIIGFSKVQGLLASPYMHAAMRRDCFDYETYIPLKENGLWRIRKIGDVVEELNPQKLVDGWGTKEIKVNNFEALGFDSKIKSVKVNNFTKHSPNKFFEIKTSLGKRIKVTENHKFLINNKKVSASELKIGDKIPLPYKINIPSRKLEELNLLDYLKDEDLMIRGVRETIEGINKNKLDLVLNKLNISKKQFYNYNLRDSYPIKFVLELDNPAIEQISKKGKIAAKRDSVEVPVIIKLTKELLEVIGLYIAEGYSRTIKGKKGLNQVYIASNEKEIRNFIRTEIKNSFGLIPSERKEDRVTFSSRVLYLFFTKILEAGSVARDKRIPSLFLNLELDKLASVLRGYFEGDGSAEKKRMKVSCDSVSDGLLYDLEFCLARFGIFAKRYEYEKEPGNVVKQFYIKKNRGIPKFKITKLIIGSDFIDNYLKIGFLSERKKKILEDYTKISPYGMEIEKDSNFVYDKIISIQELGNKESYCLNVDSENHLVVANSIVVENCDGDEAAVMLLLDVLINFSRKFLPAHRGGTQDAPLVLNSRIRAGEVDDQILDFELVWNYPLELYELAELGKHSSEIKIDNVKKRLKEGTDPFTNTGFTNDTADFNDGVINSSYKVLPTMKDKVGKQMELVSKIRAVNAADVARLIIERHFIRDIRGNLRKFSMQEFRCVSCNEKFRRPPMIGVCTKCNGKILFTISEGSIVKYLEPALELANNFAVPPYTKQGLELAKIYIQSIFGKEETKQIELKKWF